MRNRHAYARRGISICVLYKLIFIQFIGNFEIAQIFKRICVSVESKIIIERHLCGPRARASSQPASKTICSMGTVWRALDAK